MRFSKLICGLLAAAVMSGAPAAALAQSQPASVVSPQQAADEAIVHASFDVMPTGGFAALAQHLPDLKAVLDRAPASFPRIETRGNVITLREDGLAAATEVSLLLAGAAKGSAAINVEYNTYPMAAFLLASYANEMRHPDEAIAYADRGLKMQPDDSQLVTEKALALGQLHRYAEALALTEGWLKAGTPAAKDDRSRVLRAKGFDLTELGRLDEAQAAYEESLKLTPGHKGAENELTYIAQLKAGRPKTQVIITTGDKAKSGGFETQPQSPPPKP